MKIERHFCDLSCDGHESIKGAGEVLVVTKREPDGSGHLAETAFDSRTARLGQLQ